MRSIIFICIIFALKFGYASEIDIIELHANKTLDQLVLENNNIDENEIISNDIENIDSQSLEQDESTESNIDDQEVSLENNQEDITVSISDYWENIDINNLKIYFDNIKSIKSRPLYDEFLNILTDFSISSNNANHNEVFYIFVKKLIELGEIQKAYNLIKSIQINDDKNFIFYKTIELNYLFSTYQLVEACELKNEFNSQNLQLPNFYLEKADIFCLIMEEKLAESNLLNSILIETENNEDDYFQNLLNLLINYNDNKDEILLPNNYSKDLIFLYSAMLRIAEMPLSENFLEIDPNNLSIPIILSSSSDMSLRLKAANRAYLNNMISIESLAALYQSVDFNSKQLNNPENTIKNLGNNNELIMAYYFQLTNIQIFPSSRLKVMNDFWTFAESIDLEKLSYHLTYNIVSSMEPSEDNVNFGSMIATSLIYNNDFEKASKWMLFTENSNFDDENLQKVKLLYDLYQSNDTQKIVDYINSNYEDLIKIKSDYIKEILNVTINVLDNNNYNSELVFEKVMDERNIPTIYIISKIEESIKNKDEFNLFILLLVSINDRSWNEIHPKHLELFLKGINNYKNSELLKSTLLNIFENNKIF